MDTRQEKLDKLSRTELALGQAQRDMDDLRISNETYEAAVEPTIQELSLLKKELGLEGETKDERIDRLTEFQARTGLYTDQPMGGWSEPMAVTVTNPEVL